MVPLGVDLLDVVRDTIARSLFFALLLLFVDEDAFLLLRILLRFDGWPHTSAACTIPWQRRRPAPTTNRPHALKEARANGG